MVNFSGDRENRVAGLGLGTRLAIVSTVWLVLFLSWNQGWLVSGPALCPFRLLTGHPCPFCGSTRALGVFASGDFAEAWSFNPFGLLVSLTAGALFLWMNGRSWVSQRWRRLVEQQQVAVIALTAASFVAVWIWNVATRW